MAPFVLLAGQEACCFGRMGDTCMNMYDTDHQSVYINQNWKRYFVHEQNSVDVVCYKVFSAQSATPEAVTAGGGGQRGGGCFGLKMVLLLEELILPKAAESGI